MLFEGEIRLDDFYNRFGGQRQHGICTPRNKPYIYLIYSSRFSHSKYGNIDDVILGPNDKPDFFRYAFEGNGEMKNGNLAVLNHDNPEVGIYKSLLVFFLKEGMISQIGEYQRIDLDEKAPREYRSQGVKNGQGAPLYGVTEDGKKFFLLKKVTDLDEVDLKLVISNQVENGNFFVEKIGKRKDYNFLERRTDFDLPMEELPNNYTQYDFIDKNSNFVDIQGDSVEAKKANQYIFSIQSIHEELRNNNWISKTGTSGEKKDKEKYSPFLNPKIEYEKAYFYVVNVGWGLLQLLVFISKDNKREVWAFDCGRQNKNYEKNIKACLKEIYGYDAMSYRLDKLFISHPHDDHFNGYSVFEMDANTEVWINPNVRFCTNAYYDFLLEVLHKKCKVIEPVTKVNRADGVINIMHPDGHIVLDKRGSKLKNTSPIISYFPTIRKKLYEVDENTMNELSPIIKLHVYDKDIVVAGDVMRRGWECYINGRPTSASLVSPNIFVHSHHGTTSGYEINYSSINNEHDLFKPVTAEFVSIKNSYRGWTIDPTLKKVKGINRTDDITEGPIKYYRYDILNNKVNTIK